MCCWQGGGWWRLLVHHVGCTMHAMTKCAGLPAARNAELLWQARKPVGPHQASMLRAFRCTKIRNGPAADMSWQSLCPSQSSDRKLTQGAVHCRLHRGSGPHSSPHSSASCPLVSSVSCFPVQGKAQPGQATQVLHLHTWEAQGRLEYMSATSLGQRWLVGRKTPPSPRRQPAHC